MQKRRTTQPEASASRRRTPAAAGRSRAASTRRTPASSRSARPAQARTRHSAGTRAYLVPLALLALVVISAWAFYPVARVHYQEQRENERLAAELQALQERNAELEKGVKRLQTPEGIEDVARERLGMVRAGENLYLVLDDSDESTASPELDTIEVEETGGPWTPVLDIVFGVR